MQDPSHAVTGIWDVVRELMPVLTFFLMGVATFVLNRLKNSQKEVASAASDAATAASHAAVAVVAAAESADRREAKLDQVVGTVQANNVIAGETHALVNGQKAEMQAKIDALQAQLRSAGVEPQ